MRIIKIIVGIILLVFTVALSVKSYEKFTNTNCTTIKDCKTCANTMGCTYCSVAKKCVNIQNEKTACPNDSHFPVDTFHNTAEDCIDCSGVTSCVTCSKLDPCAWCKTSNKCVDSSKRTTLCPRESWVIAQDPKYGISSEELCGVTKTDISGIPYTYNREASESEIRRQLASGAYSLNTDTSSGSTTTGSSTTTSSTGTATGGSATTTGGSASTSSGTGTTTFGTPTTRWESNIGTSFDYSDPSLEYSGTSIIPILGLGRDINDHLTRQSLITVVQSAKNIGYSVSTEGEKKKLLDDIDKEKNFYINQKKEYMKKYLNNSIDYLNDTESLKKVKNLDMKIMDLSDISGFIKGINVKTSDFIEGYQAINQKDVFDYTLQKNGYANGYLEYLWMINLIALGAFVYFINR